MINLTLTKISNFEEFLKNFDNESAIIKYLWFDPEARNVTLRDYIKNHISDERDCLFAGTETDSNVFVGFGMIMFFDGENDPEVGCLIPKEHWRKGAATEIGKALVKYAFNTLGVRRITAHCDADNIGSVKSLPKIGFEFLGCEKGVRKRPDGSFADENSYQIVKIDQHYKS
jgi:RimJ/RimL family protein N-acetyltransferase